MRYMSIDTWVSMPEGEEEGTDEEVRAKCYYVSVQLGAHVCTCDMHPIHGLDCKRGRRAVRWSST